MLLAMLASLSAAVAAQTEVSVYTPGVTQEGVTYFLPKTMLEVNVTAVEEIYTPGEFSRYADRFLKLGGVSDKEQRSWQITEVYVLPVGTPDVSQAYSVRFNEKSIAPYVQLTRDGILASVNVELDKSVEIPSKQPATVRTDPHEFLTEEILTASSTAKMAELTAKEIYSIRESRNAITRGQADFIPSDGESFKFILDNLDKQEKSLMQLFTGVTTTVEHSAKFTIDPDKALSKTVIFRLSGKLGMVDAQNLAGSPVYIEVENFKSLPVPAETKKSSSKSNNSLRYCVPGRASVRIYDNRETYYDGEVSVAQYGNVEVLSSTLLNKAAGTKIVFDTATGNIISISE